MPLYIAQVKPWLYENYENCFTQDYSNPSSNFDHGILINNNIPSRRIIPLFCDVEISFFDYHHFVREIPDPSTTNNQITSHSESLLGPSTFEHENLINHADMTKVDEFLYLEY